MFCVNKIITPRSVPAKFTFKFKYADRRSERERAKLYNNFGLSVGHKPAHSLANVRNVLPTTSLTAKGLLKANVLR